MQEGRGEACRSKIKAQYRYQNNCFPIHGGVRQLFFFIGLRLSTEMYWMSILCSPRKGGLEVAI